MNDVRCPLCPPRSPDHESCEFGIGLYCIQPDKHQPHHKKAPTCSQCGRLPAKLRSMCIRCWTDAWTPSPSAAG